MDFTQWLPQGVTSFFLSYEYLALFLLFFISEAGIPLPFPNYLLVVSAGILAAQGRGSIPLILVAAVVGAVGGAWLLYWVALRGGRPLLLKYGRYIRFQPEKMARVEGWFQKRGAIAVAIGRLAPGLRIQTAMAAGLFKVSHKVFLTSTTIAAILWMGFYLWVGALIGFGYQGVGDYLKSHYQLALGGLVAVVILGASLAVIWRRRRRQRGVPSP